MSMIVRFPFLITGLLLADTSCSLGHKSSNHSSMSEVNIDWEKTCPAHAVEIKAREAWCLTSTGLDDGGQFFVYVGSDTKTATLDSVKRGAPKSMPAPFAYDKAISATKVLKGKDWSTLKTILTHADDLKDFDSGSFDGITYTLTHYVSEKAGALTSKKKLFMNNPDTDKVKAKEHLNLINAVENAAKP